MVERAGMLQEEWNLLPKEYTILPNMNETPIKSKQADEPNWSIDSNNHLIW